MPIVRISGLPPVVSGLSAIGPNDLVAVSRYLTTNQDGTKTYQSVRATPAQIFAAALASFAGGLINSGGVINSAFPFFRTSTSGLLAGDIWSDTGELTVFGVTTPDPTAPPVYFGQITAAALLLLGGANLPIVSPPAGTLQLWNDGGVICAA